MARSWHSKTVNYILEVKLCHVQQYFEVEAQLLS